MRFGSRDKIYGQKKNTNRVTRNVLTRLLNYEVSLQVKESTSTSESPPEEVLNISSPLLPLGKNIRL